ASSAELLAPPRSAAKFPPANQVVDRLTAAAEPENSDARERHRTHVQRDLGRCHEPALLAPALQLLPVAPPRFFHEPGAADAYDVHVIETEQRDMVGLRKQPTS